MENKTTLNGTHVVQQLPWKWGVQGKIFIIGGLGFMFDAWDVTMNGFLIPLIEKEWHLGIGQVATLSTANLIGMALGAFIWGGIADSIGRKKAFSATILIFSLFTVLGAASHNFELFLLFRFLAGFGLGGCIPVDYALVSEFTPKKQRGTVLTAMDGWWPIGATLCGLSAAFITSQAHGNWRHMMLIMILPALLLFWVRLSVPESPMFLMSKGKNKEATAVIEDLVERTGAKVPEWKLGKDDVAPAMSMWNVGKQLKEIWSYSWKITSVSWLLFFAVMLLYYGVITWLPKILIENGNTEAKAFMAASEMTAAGILGVVVSAALVEKFGRKVVLGISAPLSAFAMIAFASTMHDHSMNKVFLLAFGFLVQVAIPVMYAYISELYPTEMRGSGFGWASTISRIGAGLVPLIFGTWLWPTFGLPVTFTIIAALVVLAIAWMSIGAPETKGTELH